MLMLVPGRTKVSTTTASKTLFRDKKFFSYIMSIVTVFNSLALLCFFFNWLMQSGLFLFVVALVFFCSFHAIVSENRTTSSPTSLCISSLDLEKYTDFFNNRHSSDLTYHHCSQILRMHGFLGPPKTQRRKTIIENGVTEIENLMNPNRSTLTEPQIASKKSSLSIEEVSDDLEALQWQDMSVQAFRFLTFNDDDDDINGDDHVNGNGGGNLEKSFGNLVEKPRGKRGRKPKQRVLFDPVFATKPRSKKKNQKKKSLREILV